MFEAFISYSRKDKTFVQKLYHALTQQERKVWVDWQDIPLTADWRQEIFDGINAANNFIFILSPDSVASTVCGEELDHAIQQHKRLIPIVCRDVAPDRVHPELAKLNWIFFRETDDFDRAFRSLTTSLDTDLEYVKQHTRFLTRAIEWDNKQQEKSLFLRGEDLRGAETWLIVGEAEIPAPTALQRHYIGCSRQAELKKQRKRFLWVTGGAIVSSLLAIAAGIGWYAANQQRTLAEQQMLKAESESARLFSSSGQGFDALMTSLRAGLQLRKAHWRPAHSVALASGSQRSLESQVIYALQEAIYGVREQNRLMGHRDAVYSVAFSPDNQTIATASADSTIKLWNREGLLQTTLEDHDQPVYQVQFSPDGQRFASASADQLIKIWNTDGTLRQTLEGHRGKVYTIAFSPDNQLLASGSADGTIRLWDQSGQLLKTLRDDPSQPTQVSHPPNHAMQN
ncbi:MAG: TIR domain-containing protein, partial [Synechococcales bacterium]|nr:TIR domain-containing protein [Synechococcales bacterium]